MKKNILLAGLAAALVVISTSCVTGGFDSTNEKAEITFVPLADAATKAPLTSFPNSRTMVVAARYFPDGTINTGSAVNYFPATTYTYSTSNGYASSSGAQIRYWPLDNTGTLDFLAYSSPKVTAATWNSTYTLGVTLTTGDNSSDQDDILVGSRRGAYRGSNSITFKHAQALICFQAKSSVDYDGTNNRGITLTGITMNAAAHQGTLAVSRNDNSATGVFTGLSWTTSTSNNKTGITVPGSNTSRNLTTSYQSLGTGIMMPQQSNSGQYIIISYTMHNGSGVDIPMTYKYSIDGTGWAPGNQYTYQIYFNQNAITITTSIDSWGNGGSPGISI